MREDPPAGSRDLNPPEDDDQTLLDVDVPRGDDETVHLTRAGNEDQALAGLSSAAPPELDPYSRSVLNPESDEPTTAQPSAESEPEAVPPPGATVRLTGVSGALQERIRDAQSHPYVSPVVPTVDERSSVEPMVAPPAAEMSPPPPAASDAAPLSEIVAAPAAVLPITDAAAAAEPQPSARRRGWALPVGIAAIVVVIAGGALFAFTATRNSTGAEELASRQPAAPNPPAQVAAPPNPVAQTAPVPPSDPSRLYEADWTQNPGGWPEQFGWSWAAGRLRNDGSEFGDGNWLDGLWNLRWLAAPFTPPSDVSDYALEAEVVLAHRPACGSFGFVVRGTQQVGVHMCGTDTSSVLSIRSSAPALLLDEPITVGDGRHLYRLEMRPSTIRVLLDGKQIGEVTDPDTVKTGAIGLWDDHTEIEVRQFRVVKL